MIELLKAAIMGVVEGLTEFLPISSTGHLILAGSLLGFSDEKAKVFDVAIQTGAMLAVIWHYLHRLTRVAAGAATDPKARQFVVNLAIAFLPAAILGLLFSKFIKAVLFKPVPVAMAFIVGGIVILWVERGRKHAALVPSRVLEVESMSALDALKLGLAQSFALIPGTSRSGATIIGGILFGLSRKAATEFSFFLAIPTLMAAGTYDVFKHRAILGVSDLPLFAVGFVTAFLSALACVRWLLRYIASHDFVAFAWYRIGFGILILVTAAFGVVDWAG